jgi:hypothetical protein
VAHGRSHAGRVPPRAPSREGSGPSAQAGSHEVRQRCCARRRGRRTAGACHRCSRRRGVAATIPRTCRVRSRPATEFFPPARIVTEPATQLITGSGISRPTGKGEGGLGYPPRPDPVDEPTGSGVLIAELVDADRSDHSSIQPKSPASALPARDERWRRCGGGHTSAAEALLVLADPEQPALVSSGQGQFLR